MALVLTPNELNMVKNLTAEEALDAFFNIIIPSLLDRLPETEVFVIENKLLRLPSADRHRIILDAFKGHPIHYERKVFKPANRQTPN